MDLQTLRRFILQANKSGYASGKEKQWTKERDKSTTILFDQGPWKMNDNFFGGEPYGGRVIILYKNKPYWIMVYYGWITPGVAVNPVYAVLRGALKLMPEEAPFRGPKKFQEGELTYTNHWNGDVEKYSGEEQIMQGKKIIYQANYRGGLVDQRQGL